MARAGGGLRSGSENVIIEKKKFSLASDCFHGLGNATQYETKNIRTFKYWFLFILVVLRMTQRTLSTVAHTCGLYSAVGVHVQPGGMAHWLLEEQARSARDKQAQSQRAASELELERRNILNAMRYREPERGGLGPWPVLSRSINYEISPIKTTAV